MQYKIHLVNILPRSQGMNVRYKCQRLLDSKIDKKKKNTKNV